jgi:branched-subunit amino acid aminotransferase/4-amino-4-deoxychorismate lyase
MEIIPVIEKRLSLAEFHTADEVFTTGNFLFSTYILCSQVKNSI